MTSMIFQNSPRGQESLANGDDPPTLTHEMEELMFAKGFGLSRQKFKTDIDIAAYATHS